MASSELQATCLGLPLTATRPLTEEDRVLIGSWQSRREKEAWVWGPAWVTLALIPFGIPVMVAAGFLLKSDLFHVVVIAWASLFPLACLMGLVLECIWPVRSWTRYAIGFSLLSGAIGIGLNMWRSGAGDLFIWPLALDVLLGLALFTLKVADRSKLVRPSKVKKDLLNGELWEFSAEDSPVLQLLPRSGLVLRSGDTTLPSPLPFPIQMAASSPRHRWEIPAYELTPHEPEQLLTKRRMEPMEIDETRALLKAHAKGGLPATALLIILSLVLGVTTVTTLMDAEVIDAAIVGRLVVSGLSWCLVLAGILERRKLVRRLKQDLEGESLVVVRNHRAAPEAIPLAEVLPISRVIWTHEGRIGPLRQRYLKKQRIR